MSSLLETMPRSVEASQPLIAGEGLIPDNAVAIVSELQGKTIVYKTVTVEGVV